MTLEQVHICERFDSTGKKSQKDGYNTLFMEKPAFVQRALGRSGETLGNLVRACMGETAVRDQVPWVSGRHVVRHCGLLSTAGEPVKLRHAPVKVARRPLGLQCFQLGIVGQSFDGVMNHGSCYEPSRASQNGSLK